MGLVNSAANLVNRSTNGSASQNMTSNSTYSDRGRYSGSGKCIERQLNIFEVISIIFAGGFCIGQAGILGGRSGKNDSFFFFNSCFMSMCNPMGYDRPTPCFYIHAWPEAPYFITVFAFSHRNLFVAFGIPLLSVEMILVNRPI